MARKKIDNPQFPHLCRVYRIEGESSYSEGTETELYAGECVKYGSETLRTFLNRDTIKGDYALNIGKLLEGVTSGCYIDFTDYSEHRERLLVSDCYACSMGTILFFNDPKN